MKVNAFFVASLVFGVALTTGTGQAQAQMSPDLIMETYNSNINAITTSSINKHVLDNVIRRNNQRGGSAGYDAAKRGKTAAVRNVATTYTPSPQITNALRDDLISKVRARDPRSGEAFAKIFQQHNFVTVWRGLVRSYGLKTNDVADSITSYLVLGWVMANGKNDATASQVAGVRSQIKAALSSSPGFAQISNANRQRLSEGIMLQFVLQQGAAQKAEREKDTVQASRLADAIHGQILRSFGMNLRAFSLTNAGFRAKG